MVVVVTSLVVVVGDDADFLLPQPAASATSSTPRITATTVVLRIRLPPARVFARTYDAGGSGQVPQARRISVIPSRTDRTTWMLRGSAATCSLKSAMSGRSPSTTRPFASVLSATIRPRSERRGQDRLVVADVALLLGVDEDEVEVALEALDRLERRPDVERDLRAVRRAVEVPLRERRPLRVELAGVDPPALRQRSRHRERRMAAERADLEDALRPPEPDEQLEEPAGDRPGQHLRHPEHVGGLRRQLREEILVR